MVDYGANRMTHMPTYRMEPREHERFYPAQVRKIIEQVIRQRLEGIDFDHAKHKQWAEAIVVDIKEQTKQLNIPSYKIIVQCVIGQVLGQGVRVASKCLWDAKNDNYASWNYENSSLFCTGIVFGIYYE